MTVMSLIATYKSMEMPQLERWTSHDRPYFASRLVKAGVSEHLILKTCNRFEIYAAGQDIAGLKGRLEELAAGMKTPGAYVLEGADSIKHLMVVCSGLDSMILGEQEIQHQVKSALAEAQSAGSSSKVLNYVVMSALAAAKRVRSSTALASGAFSIPRAAAEMVKNAARVRSICVVGTGWMAGRILGELSGSGLSVTVFGRDVAKLKVLSDEFHVGSAALSSLDCSSFDAVITAVASTKPIINIADAGRPLIVVDIGNPRNVGAHGRATYIDLSVLKNYAHANSTLSRSDAVKANRIISQAADAVVAKLNMMEADAMIASLYRRAGEAVSKQREKALKLLGPESTGAIDSLTSALSNAIIGEQVRRIKRILGEGDADKISMLREIYGDAGGEEE